MDERHSQGWAKPGTRPLIGAGVLIASLAVASVLASPLVPAEAAVGLALKLGAMWPALVYLGAGLGLGFPMRRWWREAADPLAIQLGVGLALLFSLSQILGGSGLLTPAAAIGLCVLGLALAAWQGAIAVKHRRGPGEGSLAWALGAPAAAMLIVASAMPPGWLWQSEYGGYDALSYHLQLPQEWLAAGRIAPLGHNVYSYLPGYVEAAFVHLGALSLAPADGGLLGGEGWRLISCQALHAGLAIVAAWLTGRATRRFARNSGCEEGVARWAGAVAGCFGLATPWAVVTGSLAYNEAGVNAMLAAALVVCAQPRLAPAARGALVGLLLGVACGFKPTSLFFAGVPAGIMLVASCVGADRRSLLPAIGWGALVGAIALAPWLIRNALHGGNPVFPFASDLFGTAHWTMDQVARYRSAHTFDGSIVGRVQALFWTSPVASPGDTTVERFRGFANPQWGLFLPIVVVTAGALVAKWREARATALILSGSLFAQILCWLALTHLQSRFLLPALPIGAALLGLALARLRTAVAARPDGRAAAGLLASVLVLAQSGFLLVIYLGQQGGNAGAAIGTYPDVFTGATDARPEDSAQGWCNLRHDKSELVYLIGDGAPLYFGQGIVYHTTFDRSPLGDLMRAAPDDPGAWARGLLERGVRWLVVSPGEIGRLQRSGWYDPTVTPEAVRDFSQLLGGADHVWQGEGRYLVYLHNIPPAPGEE